MATPLQAIKQVAETTLGFYAFAFADEIAQSEVQDVAEWAQNNNRMLITTVTDVDEAITLGESLKGSGLYHHSITYHQDYTATGAVAGMGLDQRYDTTNGIKTLHLKSLRGVESSSITQTQAAQLTAAGINFYSDYGNPDNSLAVFTNGFAGDGMYFDFIMGIDWLRNAIEVSVFNGQRTRRTTPQTSRGQMMVKADIAQAMEAGVAAGLIGPGTWNGQSVGEVETYDYLENGYYIYHESVLDQDQADRAGRTSQPYFVIAKGAGAFHNIDIILTPQV